MKKSSLLLSLSLLVMSTQVGATTIEQLSEQIKALQAKTESLQAELIKLKHEKSKQVDSADSNGVFDDVARTRALFGPGAPYFGTNATYDGAMLLINEPTIYKDLGLLRQRQYMDKAFGPVSVSGSRAEISGTFATQYYHHSNTFGIDGEETSSVKGHSNFYADAELDMAAQVDDWLLGYSKFAADTETTQLTLISAFVTAGNLEKFPVFLTTGYFYVPFGAYSTHMVTSSLPKLVGRTKGNAASIGYVNEGFNAAVFALAGDSKDEARKKVDQFGADFNYKHVFGEEDGLSMKVGASVINNIASAGGQPTFANNGRIQDYVAAYDGRVSLGYKGFGILAEYVAPFEDFNQLDMRYNNSGAMPRASLFELSYDFDTFGRSSYVALSYGETQEALALQLPEKQYGIAYVVDLYEHTILALEYLNKKDYSRGDFSEVSNSGTLNRGTGVTDHIFTTEIDLYF